MGKKNGYVKIYRVGEDWRSDELFRKEPLCKWAAWIDLISLAEYRDGETERHGVTVPTKRGCVYKSVRELAARWRWSTNKVLRFLSTLNSLGKTETQKSNVINCISIVKYEQYQGDGNTNEDTNGNTNEDTNGNTSKNNKEYKENKELDADACVRAHEENQTEEEKRVLGFQAEILKSQVTVEQTCMTLHITPQQYQGLIQDFTAEQIAKGTAYLGYSDYRRHAYDWIRIHASANDIDPEGHTKEAKQKQKGQSNGTASNSTGNDRYAGLSPKDRAIHEADRKDLIEMGIDPDKFEQNQRKFDWDTEF